MPDGPAGVMVRAFAWTLPDESLGPAALKHCPVCSSASVTTAFRVTLAVEDTVIVTSPEVVV